MNPSVTVNTAGSAIPQQKPKESALAFPIHNNLVNNRALQNKCFEQDFTNRLGSQNPFL